MAYQNGSDAFHSRAGVSSSEGPEPPSGAASPAVLETIVSPFHCFYQDAFHLHSQARALAVRSESEASQLARAAFLMYLSSAEALVHQAAVELGRPELAPLLADPSRPMPLAEVWRMLPAIATEPTGPIASSFDPKQAPWPQFSELLALRASWAYPGPPSQRRMYYRALPNGRDFEPLQPHQIPEDLDLAADRLVLPRTGLPRDPYALRAHHLDTARSVLDAAITALDQRLGGRLKANHRHRCEPVRVVHQSQPLATASTASG